MPDAREFAGFLPGFCLWQLRFERQGRLFWDAARKELLRGGSNYYAQGIAVAESVAFEFSSPAVRRRRPYRTSLPYHPPAPRRPCCTPRSAAACMWAAAAVCDGARSPRCTLGFLAADVICFLLASGVPCVLCGMMPRSALRRMRSALLASCGPGSVPKTRTLA